MRKKLLLLQLYYRRFLKLFEFKNLHQPFILKFHFNCETPNLIYIIICSGCNKEYIGQTGGQLKNRLSIYSKFDNVNMKK